MFARYLGGDFAGAGATVDEAARRYRELGDQRGLARTHWTRATIALQSGDAAGAIGMFERSLDMFDATGDARYHAMAAGSLAWAHWSIGDVATAGRWLKRGIVETRAMRDIASLTINLPAAAVHALAARGPETAATLLGAFESLRQLYGIEPPAGMSFLIETRKPIERARDALGNEAFDAALERGRRMSLDEALDLIAGVSDPA